MIKILFISSLCFFNLIFLSGCDAVNKAAKSSESSLSYDLTVNGCATGSHSFSSLDSYCAGLQNNALNNNCAQTSRGDLFYQNCSGTFTPALITINSIQF